LDRWFNNTERTRGEVTRTSCQGRPGRSPGRCDPDALDRHLRVLALEQGPPDAVAPPVAVSAAARVDEEVVPQALSGPSPRGTPLGESDVGNGQRRWFHDDHKVGPIHDGSLPERVANPSDSGTFGGSDSELPYGCDNRASLRAYPHCVAVGERGVHGMVMARANRPAAPDLLIERVLAEEVSEYGHPVFGLGRIPRTSHCTEEPLVDEDLDDEILCVAGPQHERAAGRPLKILGDPFPSGRESHAVAMHHLIVPAGPNPIATQGV